MTRITLVPDDLEAHAAAGDEAIASLRLRLVRLRDLASTYRWTNPQHAVDPGPVLDGLAHWTRRHDILGDQVARLALAARELDERLDLHGRAHVDPDELDAAVADLRHRWVDVADLRDLLEVANERWWIARVFPGGRAWCGPDTYVGSGAVLGPDGRRYPLVVPEVRHEGRLVRGDADGTVDVATLAGRDPGWATVDVATGVSRIRDDLRWYQSFAVASLGFNPRVTSRLTGRPATERVRSALHVDPNGVPRLEAVDVPTTGGPAPTTPPVAPPEPRRVPGRTPGRTRGPFRRRAAGTPPVGTALDVGIGALEGMVLLDRVRQAGRAAWQVVFEQHPDGRRRARMRLYEVAATEDGDVVVNPSAVSVDPDGELVRHHLRFARADEPQLAPPTSPPGTALHLVQYPDEPS